MGVCWVGLTNISFWSMKYFSAQLGRFDKLSNP